MWKFSLIRCKLNAAGIFMQHASGGSIYAKKTFQYNTFLNVMYKVPDQHSGGHKTLYIERFISFWFK
jgi:hypothetical protein